MIVGNKLQELQELQEEYDKARINLEDSSKAHEKVRKYYSEAYEAYGYSLCTYNHFVRQSQEALEALNEFKNNLKG